jgi:hypothetical protein
MLKLRDVQDGVRRAVLGSSRPDIIAAILGEETEAEARLNIHRHHVIYTLTEALRANFPVVCRVVDPRFFAYAADAFIRSNPPTAPCLAEYGEAFPDFLASFEPARGLPYLADLAKLEWAVVEAKYAADALPISAETLRHVPVEDYPNLAFNLDPSLRLLHARSAVQRIWAAFQEPNEPESIELGSEQAWLVVRRRNEAVEVANVEPATFAFIAVLRSGRPLAEAGEAGLAADPFFDMATALRRLLVEDAFVGFAVLSTPTEELSEPC